MEGIVPPIEYMYISQVYLVTVDERKNVHPEGF